MSNISVRKDEPTRAIAPTSSEWDPARMMRQFFGWDPFRQMEPLARLQDNAFIPAFEVKETKEGYLFKADLPGVKEQDVDITVTGNRLQVSGRREAEKQEKTDTYYMVERSYGSFTRAFTLPDDVEVGQVHADLKDGVLTLSIPRKPENQPKKIPLKTAPKS